METSEEKERDMETNNSYMNLSAKGLFEELGGKPLTTKKNILEYIDTIRKLAKNELEAAQVKESYAFIDEQIEALGSEIKVNTMVYLKNELRNKLGKFTPENKSEDNAFLEFYKKTFENQVKTKEYTWAMVDLSRLSETSILETLKTINTYALKTKLSPKEKEDILPMVKRIVDTQNLRLINQVRSMEGLRKAFRMKIVEVNKRFEMKKI